MKMRRSILFMPGNNPGMLQSATVFGADSVILDLEDAVSLTEKDSARILMRNACKTLDFSSTELVIRINPLDTSFAFDDIDTMARLKPDAILLPKANESDMKTLNDLLNKIENEENFENNSIKIIALIETAYGVETVYDVIKSTTRCIGVLLGGEDLAADLAVPRTKEGEEIFYARTKVVNACKALKVSAIDTPFTDTNDLTGLINDTKKAKALGFTCKSSINPRQIEAINNVFSPTKAEISHAKRVIAAKDEAFSKGLGVFSLDGKMIDKPIITRAETTLNNAKKLGLL